MIQIKSKQVLCNHSDFCTHRKVDKCPLEQQRLISHAFQPPKTFVKTNHPISRSNQYKSNISTLAYEKYLANQLPIQEDEMKGQNIRRITDYLNIIEITEEQMKPGNAYNLAEYQSAEHQLREKLERERIMRAKKRANQELRKKLEEKQAKQDAEKMDEVFQKLIKKLNTVADHIILRGGQSTGARERQLLEQKAYLNLDYIAELKIKDRNAALGILDDIRVLLLKHKVKNQHRREDIENQKKADSTINASISMMNNSAVTSEAGTLDRQIQREEAFLNKFCNFEALQKKWLKQNVQQVRDAIRRVLATRILAHAQRQVVRNRKHKQSLDTKAIRSLSPPYLKTVKDLEKKGKLKAPEQKQNEYQKKFIEGNDLWSVGLDQIELRVKLDWLKNNEGYSAGQMLQRQLNYVKLFDSKARQCSVKFELKYTADEDHNEECDCGCHYEVQQKIDNRKTRYANNSHH